MKRTSVFSFSFLILLVSFVSFARDVHATIVVNEVPMVARQQVNFTAFNVQETLVANGTVKWTFDVDANNNTIPGGASKVEALFNGRLPSGFGGLADAPFELFTLPGGSVTASNNGTSVSTSTNFGLRVFSAPNVVLANFFTTTPSLFQSNVISLTNFSGSVFQDPARPNDVTQVFIGANGLGQQDGSLVGISFDRTVTAVPEPSSLMLCSLIGLTALVYRKRRKAKTGLVYHR